MYLSRLQIANFRGISSLSVTFRKGINVLIGENTTCKTAVLDALRICLGLALERRDLYIQPEDFFTSSDGTQATSIEFELTFAGLKKQQQGVFVELLELAGDGGTVLALHVRFVRDADRIRRTIWGGANEGQEIPFQVLELLYFTYLGALRDAARDLSPSRSNRLSQLFLKLVSDLKEREQYAMAINQRVHSDQDWQKLLANAEKGIQAHLNQMLLRGDETKVAVEFVDATYRQIAEGLRLYMPRTATAMEEAHPQKPDAAQVVNRFSIFQNSLGLNNLLYIATVLGDLVERAARQPEAYVALLIEEPEAHLHPQWQNTLFAYACSIEQRGIQVFISSHSPTITARSDIDALIAMTREGATVKAIPVRHIAISASSKKHLQRFLDVTKCQLFFARSVILVEGISEVLLMPLFASRLGEEYDLAKNGVEVVNIDGVAFEPFAALFNGAKTDARLNVRCAIITDDDRNETVDPSPRAANALALESGMLRVFLAKETFEYELFSANEQLLLDVYGSMHPKTDLKFSGAVQNRAELFVDKLRVNKDKALLAQSLVCALQDVGTLASFVVPNYIQDALKWAVIGDATKTH
jgi:putative ATP-dependent endonuclease of the OLD family